eukprot:CAMPEP_0202896946 /NCGR_PEP_ID=MMETSP1392-20130828/5836_1 /ASSEMBLY_ACC=CAM_ASM_000868 /TAXON_ID=225041 /ORGANISM="Chlamydomonas chlamydogama, Strain SAG 11-48b" /LENGTH=664 /DNA_ID=CAMNT_0049582465 /DNA_START=49 /DNA_END=2043 /DNA_ORIENTATION=+
MATPEWLVIEVLEARALGAFDISTSSSDPFVTLSLAKRGKDVSESQRTRVAHRNRHPMFSERFAFNLSKLKDADSIKLEVFDQDYLSSDFMGKVEYPLDELLKLASKAPYSRWFALAGKRPGDKAEGELHFQASVFTEQEYMEHNTKAPVLKRDPASLHQRLAEMWLEVNLQRLGHNLVPGTSVQQADAMKQLLQDLSMEVCLGKVITVFPLRSTGMETGAGAIVLPLKQKIQIPLENCFASKAWDKKGLDEAADIRLYVKSGNEVLAKTQVPIWDVPVQTAPSTPSTPTAQAAGSGDAAAAGDGVEAKAYTRTLQTYSWKLLGEGNMDVTFTVKLLPKPPPPPQAALTASPSTAGEQPPVMVADDMTSILQGSDDREAAPLASVPPPLDLVVVDTLMAAGPQAVYRELISEDASAIKTMIADAHLTNLKIGPWSMKQHEQYAKALFRTVSYTKPLNIPFAPKSADVMEDQRVYVKEAGGFVFEKRISTNAPKGDCFFVQQQFVAVSDGKGSSKLNVSIKVNFVKSAGLLKSTIQGVALKEGETNLKTLVANARQSLLSNTAPSQIQEVLKREGVVPDAAPVAAEAAAPAAVGAPGAAVPAAAAGGVNLGKVLMVLAVALLILLHVWILMIVADIQVTLHDALASLETSSMHLARVTSSSGGSP